MQHRLVVRDAESLQIVCLFNCNGNIAHTEWSPCERYILCAGWSRKAEGFLGQASEGGGWVQVFEVVRAPGGPSNNNAGAGSAATTPWQARIEEGAVGMVRAMWYVLMRV